MIVKPNFIAGDEKRFFDFIKNLSGDDRIALISHTDLDGIASAKIANEVLQADLVKFANYEMLNGNLANELRKSKINKIILLDLNITNEDFVSQLERFSKILIIDHHSLIRDYNSHRTTFLNAQGFSAAYLSYFLFSKITDLSDFDWLAACSSISDFLYFRNEAWMREVLEKYGESYKVVGDSIDNRLKIWKTQKNISYALIYFKGKEEEVYRRVGRGYNSIGDIPTYASIVQEEIDRGIIDFQKSKEKINDGYYCKIKSKWGIKEIVVNFVSSSEKSKTFIIGQTFGERTFLSARRQDGKVNMPDLLKRLIKDFENSGSGGHIKAAGAFFPTRYLDVFERRLRNSSFIL